MEGKANASLNQALLCIQQTKDVTNSIFKKCDAFFKQSKHIEEFDSTIPKIKKNISEILNFLGSRLNAELSQKFEHLKTSKSNSSSAQTSSSSASNNLTEIFGKTKLLTNNLEDHISCIEKIFKAFHNESFSFMSDVRASCSKILEQNSYVENLVSELIRGRSVSHTTKKLLSKSSSKGIEDNHNDLKEIYKVSPVNSRLVYPKNSQIPSPAKQIKTFSFQETMKHQLSETPNNLVNMVDIQSVMKKLLESAQFIQKESQKSQDNENLKKAQQVLLFDISKLNKLIAGEESRNNRLADLSKDNNKISDSVESRNNSNINMSPAMRQLAEGNQNLRNRMRDLKNQVDHDTSVVANGESINKTIVKKDLNSIEIDSYKFEIKELKSKLNKMHINFENIVNERAQLKNQLAANAMQDVKAEIQKTSSENIKLHKILKKNEIKIHDLKVSLKKLYNIVTEKDKEAKALKEVAANHKDCVNEKKKLVEKINLLESDAKKGSLQQNSDLVIIEDNSSVNNSRIYKDPVEHIMEVENKIQKLHKILENEHNTERKGELIELITFLINEKAEIQNKSPLDLGGVTERLKESDKRFTILHEDLEKFKINEKLIHTSYQDKIAKIDKKNRESEEKYKKNIKELQAEIINKNLCIKELEEKCSDLEERNISVCEKIVIPNKQQQSHAEKAKNILLLLNTKECNNDLDDLLNMIKRNVEKITEENRERNILVKNSQKEVKKFDEVNKKLSEQVGELKQRLDSELAAKEQVIQQKALQLKEQERKLNLITTSFQSVLKEKINLEDKNSSLEKELNEFKGKSKENIDKFQMDYLKEVTNLKKKNDEINKSFIIKEKRVQMLENNYKQGLKRTLDQVEQLKKNLKVLDELKIDFQFFCQIKQILDVAMKVQSTKFFESKKKKDQIIFTLQEKNNKSIKGLSILKPKILKFKLNLIDLQKKNKDFKELTSLIFIQFHQSLIKSTHLAHKCILANNQHHDKLSNLTENNKNLEYDLNQKNNKILLLEKLNNEQLQLINLNAFKISELIEKNKSKKKLIQNQSEMINSLNDHMSKIELKNKSLDEANKDLLLKNSINIDEAKQIKIDYDLLKIKNAQLQTNNMSLENQISKINSTAEINHKHIQQLTASLAEQQSLYDQSDQLRKKFQIQYDKLFQENSDLIVINNTLKEQLNQASIQLAAALNNNTQLEAQVQKIQVEIAELKNQYNHDQNEASNVEGWVISFKRTGKSELNTFFKKEKFEKLIMDEVEKLSAKSVEIIDNKINLIDERMISINTRQCELIEQIKNMKVVMNKKDEKIVHIQKENFDLQNFFTLHTKQISKLKDETSQTAQENTQLQNKFSAQQVTIESQTKLISQLTECIKENEILIENMKIANVKQKEEINKKEFCIQDHLSTIETLKTEIMACESKLHQIKNNCASNTPEYFESELKNQILSLEKEKFSLLKELEDSNVLLIEKNNQILTLNKVIDKNNALLLSLEEVISNLKEEKIKADKIAAEYIESITSSTNKCLTIETNISNMAAERDQALQSMRDYQNENTKLIENLNNNKHIINSLQEEIQKLSEKSSLQENKILKKANKLINQKTLVCQLTECIKDNEIMIEDYKKMNEELANFKDTSEKTIISQENLIENLKSEISLLQNNLREYEVKLNQEKLKFSTLEAEEKAKEELTKNQQINLNMVGLQLEKVVQEKEQLEKNICKQSAQALQDADTIDNLTKSLSKLENQFKLQDICQKNNETKIDELLQKIKELDFEKSSNVEIIQKYKTMEEIAQNKIMNLTEEQKKNDDLMKKQSIIMNNLEQEIQNNNKIITQLTEQIISKDSIISQLTSSSSECKNDLIIYENDKKIFQSQIITLQNIINNHQNKIIELESLKSSLESSLSERQDHFTQQMHTISEEKLLLEKSLQKMSADNENLIHRAANSENECKILQEKVMTLENKNKGLENNMQELRSLIDESLAKIVLLTNENENLSKIWQEQTKSLDNLQEKIILIENEKIKSNENVQQLTKTIENLQEQAKEKLIFQYKLENSLQELEEKINKNQIDLLQYENELKKNLDCNNELKQNNLCLISQINELQEEMTKLKQANSELLLIKSNLEKKISDNLMLLDSNSSKYLSQIEKYQKLEKISHQQTKTIELLSSQTSNLVSQKNQLEIEMNDKTDLISKIRLENDELRNTLNLTQINMIDFKNQLKNLKTKL